MLSYLNPDSILNQLIQRQPRAVAWVSGNEAFPELKGTVRFYPCLQGGMLVEAEFFHLPAAADGSANAFFGFHIHENGDCSDSFENTGSHYNPSGAAHPFHEGDLPPLMSNSGYAWAVFYDGRTTLPEVLGRSAVVHRMPDDFTSQPAGNAGEKIGCGVILPI